MIRQWQGDRPGGGAVENLRIRFWGVQGSCPVFPPRHEVQEFSRRIAIQVLERAMTDIAARSARTDGRCSVEELIGGPINPATVAAYQRRLGLPDFPVYGGETTCVQIDTADDEVILLDGGSGIRHFAKHIIDRWKDREGARTLYFFGSHEHLDHRSGLPFSRFVFVRNNPFTLQVYGSHRFLSALDERFGIFSRQIRETTHLDDPLDYTMMAAVFRATEIRNFCDLRDVPSGRSTPWALHDMRDPIRIGETTITAFDVYHGLTRVLAYKVQRGGRTFVFCTDHELRHGTDPADDRERESRAAEARLVEHCTDADVGYFDGQYQTAEYQGKKGIGTSPPVPKVDWGHGCIEDVVARAVRCNIRRTYIGHHDPDREWSEQVEMDRELEKVSRTHGCHIELAKPDTVIDL